jgi:hypothetical protein
MDEAARVTNISRSPRWRRSPRVQVMKLNGTGTGHWPQDIALLGPEDGLQHMSHAVHLKVKQRQVMIVARPFYQAGGGERGAVGVRGED